MFDFVAGFIAGAVYGAITASGLFLVIAMWYMVYKKKAEGIEIKTEDMNGD